MHLERATAGVLTSSAQFEFDVQSLLAQSCQQWQPAQLSVFRETQTFPSPFADRGLLTSLHLIPL
jgi:hypothetical protein